MIIITTARSSSSQGATVKHVEKLASVLVPQDCYHERKSVSNHSSSILSLTQNDHKYEGVIVNCTILQAITLEDQVFILTSDYLLKLTEGLINDRVSVIDTDEVTLFTAREVTGIDPIIMICYESPHCIFYNSGNLSDSKSFPLLSLPIVDPDNFEFDSNYSYHLNPIGKSGLKSCRTLEHFYLTSNVEADKAEKNYPSIKNIQMFNFLNNYRDIIYFFQSNKSSYLVSYDNILTVTEIHENNSKIIKTKRNFKCDKPVASFYDPKLNRLHIMIRNKSNYQHGWVDVSDENLNSITFTPITNKIQQFKEFYVTDRHKIVLNLGKEILMIDGNNTERLVSSDNSISLLLSQNSPLSFYTISISSLRDNTRLLIYSSVIGLILILIITIGIIFSSRKLRGLILRRANNGNIKMNSFADGAGESVSLQSRSQNRPIFIFSDSLSDIVILTKGAFGEVAKGIFNDGINRHEVAIKSLLRFDIEKVKREAEIACSLNHPNVLALIGISFDDKIQQLKLVLPFMKNSDLASYLEKNHGEITGKDLKSFALQIISGMIYLISEDKGHPSIIHRDLATRNCMVDSDLTIKVADFGLSRYLDETKLDIRRSMHTSLVPSNGAPESKRRNIFNEKTDVWSFGLLLMDLFAGEVPSKILEISSVCFSSVPNLRPTFVDLAKMVKKLSNSDFELSRDTIDSTFSDINNCISEERSSFQSSIRDKEDRDKIDSGLVSGQHCAIKNDSSKILSSSVTDCDSPFSLSIYPQSPHLKLTKLSNGYTVLS